MSNLALDAKGHAFALETLALTDNTTSLTYDVINRDTAFFQFVWADLDAADGTIEMQYTNDLSLAWDTYPDSTITLTTASGSHSFDVVVSGPRYLRLKYSKGSNTAGSASLSVVSKKRTK